MCYVAKDNLEHVILLSPTVECWVTDIASMPGLYSAGMDESLGMLARPCL